MVGMSWTGSGLGDSGTWVNNGNSISAFLTERRFAGRLAALLRGERFFDNGFADARAVFFVFVLGMKELLLFNSISITNTDRSSNTT